MKQICKYLILPMLFVFMASFDAFSMDLDGTWQSEDTVFKEGNITNHVTVYYAFNSELEIFMEVKKEVASYPGGTAIGFVFNGGDYRVEGDNIILNYDIDVHDSASYIDDDNKTEKEKEDLMASIQATYLKECQDNVGFNVIYPVKKLEPKKLLTLIGKDLTTNYKYIGNFDAIRDVR